MGTPATKYFTIEVKFIVAMTSNKELIPGVIREISERMNITLSKIEKVEGVKLVTGYNIDTKEL